MNKHFELLERAYSLTNNTTPCRFDCGTLCGAVCCNNLSLTDNNSGMHLLPYEKEYLQSKKANGYEYVPSEDGYMLDCGGKCIRDQRPFACRIFPYYAKFDGNSIIIKKDIRAASVCPLLTNEKTKRANIFFIRNMKKAIRILIENDDFYSDLKKTADFVDSLYDLYSKMQ